MNNINKTVFAYLAVVVFILWVCSVIESFIPCNWKWFFIAVQVFFVIKIAFFVSILIFALFVIFRNKVLGPTKAKE